jgi:beta-glucanase (GH16 family)
VLVATAAAGSPQAASSSRSTPAVTERAEDACGKVRLKPSGQRWRCSFVDDFAGRRLDPDKWLTVATEWSGFRMGSSCLMPENVRLRRGTLRIVARDEGRTFLCRSSRGSFNTRYTGGHIATHERFAQTYGKFEVRARFPAMRKGVHGAFWLYPKHLTYGRWPRSGEIDVAEWWSVAPRTVMPSLHYNGSRRLTDSGEDCRVDDATQYHVYTVVWSSEVMRFRIDGRTCFRRVWAPSWPMFHPQPFDHPFNLVLTFGADRLYSHNSPSASTGFPGAFQVDYAKVWR